MHTPAIHLLQGPVFASKPHQLHHRFRHNSQHNEVTKWLRPVPSQKDFFCSKDALNIDFYCHIICFFCHQGSFSLSVYISGTAAPHWALWLEVSLSGPGTVFWALGKRNTFLSRQTLVKNRASVKMVSDKGCDGHDVLHVRKLQVELHQVLKMHVQQCWGIIRT